jgi:hypothetical protein
VICATFSAGPIVAWLPQFTGSIPLKDRANLLSFLVGLLLCLIVLALFGALLPPEAIPVASP